MKTIDAKRIEILNAELELILLSTADPRDQFIGLSRFFYKLVKISTNEESLAFRNFYARFRYLISQINLTNNDRENIDAFRRFIKRGNQKQADLKSVQQGVALMLKMLSLVAENDLEAKPVYKRLKYKDDYFCQFFHRVKYDTLKDLKVLCSSWTALVEDNGLQCFTLHAYDLENLQQKVSITFYKHPYADFTTLHKLLTENAILQLQFLKFTGKGINQYATTPESLVVLEPDFLIDATNIGECFGFSGSNSDLFFLSHMLGDLPGKPALQGSIVGFYLDEFVRNKKQSVPALFLTAQRNNALKAVQLGKATMQELKSEIEANHLHNIHALVEKQNGKDVWIEPTYFSKEYGLLGRLDLLAIDKKLNSKDIVELKSGTPTDPNSKNARPSHRMQVVCYDMLLQSTYGLDRTGANTVYYSQCKSTPSRPIVSEHDEKINVLTIRNEIVAKIYKLAATDFTVLQTIKEKGISHLPKFKEMALNMFQQFYDPSRIATQYYQELLAFSLREMINTKVGDLIREDEEDCQHGFAGLWLDSLKEKETDFRIISDLEVNNIDKLKGHITLNFDRNTSHCFRKGDLVIMYPKTKEGYNPLTQHILKGSIHELSLDGMVVSLYNLQTNYSFIETHSHWAIETDIYERNFWSTISCLFNVLSCSQPKKKLLFGNIEPRYEENAVYKSPDLTAQQNTVIERALNAKDYYLLQGPPGTGKTSTFLVHYVREALRTTNDKIIVLAFTNKAVEKICESFRQPRKGMAPIEYLRFGSKHVEDERLFTSQLQDDDPANWQQILDSNRVFVTTVATFQNNWLQYKQFMTYNQVIVDEASQLTEAALAGVLVLFDKFILIGDEKQLPSVVTQDVRTCLTKSEYLHKLGVTDFRISLFERLINNAKAKGWNKAHDQLSDHYRMHQDIADLISKHYRRTLEAGRPAQKSTSAPYSLPEGHLLWAISQHRTVFIETPSDNGLKKNKQEALIAATIAQQLIEAGVVKPSEIGIITPFRAQIAEIKKNMPTEILNDKDFLVDTVERYQGDERKIIIFSTTITSPRQVGAIQSIASNDEKRTDRKLLVSISRAREQFIVLGNSEALCAAEAYRDMIDEIKSRNGYWGIDFAITALTNTVQLMSFSTQS